MSQLRDGKTQSSMWGSLQQTKSNHHVGWDEITDCFRLVRINNCEFNYPLLSKISVLYYDVGCNMSQLRHGKTQSSMWGSLQTKSNHHVGWDEIMGRSHHE